MARSDYPSDPYTDERESFIHSPLKDAAILGAIVAVAVFVGAYFSPSGLKPLWDLLGV